MKRFWPLFLSICLLPGHVSGQDRGFCLGEGGPLHQAAFVGDLAKIEERIARHVSVDERDPFGRTPLYCAAAAGRKDIAELLIARGADVQAAFPYSYRERDRGDFCYEEYHVFSGTSAPPVVAAASSGNLDMVKCLTDHGAKLTAGQVDEFTLLHSVTNVAMAEFFIDLGADVNRRDGAGTTPVYHAAIWKERHAVARLLLRAGADLNMAGKYETPLAAAARMGHVELVNLFLEQGADPNVMGETFSASPLTACARFGKTEMIKLLLKAGADPNRHPENSGTALHFAADGGHVEAARILLAAGARIEAETLHDQRTALHTAARFGQVSVAELLLDNGAKIEAADENRLTALHLAAIEGRSSMVALLLDRGAEVDARTAQDMTALQGAVSHAILRPDEPFFYTRRICEISREHVKSINLLAQAGADLNATRSNGRTALICAIEECTVETQDLPMMLIRLGADVGSRDPKEAVPLDLAREKKLENVVRLIKSKIKVDQSAEPSPEGDRAWR